jgi:hypothetical protein
MNFTLSCGMHIEKNNEYTGYEIKIQKVTQTPSYHLLIPNRVFARQPH